MKIKFAVIILISIVVMSIPNLEFTDFGSWLNGMAVAVNAIAWMFFAMIKIVEPYDKDLDWRDLIRPTALILVLTIVSIEKMDWNSWQNGFSIGEFAIPICILILILKIFSDNDFFD